MNPYGGSEIKRLKAKLKRHPVLGKARIWAWVAPGNVTDPIALAVIAARLQGAELILKLSRRNEKAGRAVARRHLMKGQKVRIVVDPAAFRKLAARADAWVVYGSDATLKKMRREAPPTAGWVGHGHRISFSIIFRSRLRSATALLRAAKACARDIHPHDQLGCLSPQIVWVEGDPVPFAAALRSELGKLEAVRGRAHRDPETLRARRALLNELRVRALDPRELQIVGNAGTQYSLGNEYCVPALPVVYWLGRGKFIAPGGAQVVAVKGFSSVGDVRRGMKLFRSHVQGVAVAGTRVERARVRSAFRDSTAAYWTEPGRLQTPPLDWQI